MAPYSLGVIPSPEDKRDFIFEKIFKISAPLNTIDLRKYCTPVRNQGSQGSCVAMGLAASKEVQERLDIKLYDYLSPQYIYNQRTNQSEGMYPREGLKILKENGIPLEIDYPYLTKNTITDELKTKARNHSIDSYFQVTTVEGVKEALNREQPVGFAVPVYNFGTTMWNASNPNENIVGYHWMCFVGYTETGFIVRNSWGESWGNNGYTIMPFDDFKQVVEAWYSIDKKSNVLSNKEKLKLWWANVKLWFSKNQTKVIIVGFSVIALTMILIGVIKGNK